MNCIKKIKYYILFNIQIFSYNPNVIVIVAEKYGLFASFVGSFTFNETLGLQIL